MKNNKKILLFLLAIVLQIGILFSMVYLNEARIHNGKKIIVKTVPVDPRSLFRGDYIELNYDFSRINLKQVNAAKQYFSWGSKVFVKLSKVDEDWGIAFVSDKPIEDVKPRELVIAGIVDRSWFDGYIAVKYGIESYFIPEGKGKYIENQISKKRVKVELSVDKQGYASVCRLFIDDKEVSFR